MWCTYVFVMVGGARKMSCCARMSLNIYDQCRKWPQLFVHCRPNSSQERLYLLTRGNLRFRLSFRHPLYVRFYSKLWVLYFLVCCKLWSLKTVEKREHFISKWKWLPSLWIWYVETFALPNQAAKSALLYVDSFVYWPRLAQANLKFYFLELSFSKASKRTFIKYKFFERKLFYFWEYHIGLKIMFVAIKFKCESID